MNESNNPREFLVLFPRVMFFIILAGWIALFFFSSPEALIEYIGVQNGYLLIFLLSFVSGLSVFYGALIPFSNDFVGVTMGLARYPFWRVMVPLTLGTAVFNATLAFGAVYAYGLVESFFR